MARQKMMEEMEWKIQKLQEKNVTILDPRQTYISREVEIDRIGSGSILYPGTRLTGKRTFIGSYAKIGTEGPAAVSDSVIGPHAEVASGFLSGTTLLPRARAGANAHFRPGTLLEEEASTAHAVGLKQSVLMYGVTLGSLINFCDVLITGGKSRVQHTEVGSGFIHFNYAPWGEAGDKATPSLIGTVTEGVFLDQPRIFLGGLSGIVGPSSIGFGTMTAAGQVIRKPVAANQLHAEAGVNLDKVFSESNTRLSDRHLKKIQDHNIEFLAQLYALKKWYQQIRLKRCRFRKDKEMELVLQSAVETVDVCIEERILRYNKFAKEWNLRSLEKDDLSVRFTELSFEINWKPELEYDQWIWQLEWAEKDRLHEWLKKDADRIKGDLYAMVRRDQ